MRSHVEFVKTVICSKEMAVQYLREHNLLDNLEEAVINCDKCGSVMQNKRRLIRGKSIPVMRCPRKGCQVMRSVRHGNNFFHYWDLNNFFHYWDLNNKMNCKLSLSDIGYCVFVPL